MGYSGSHLFSQAVGCALTSATICLGQKRDKTRIRKAEAAHEAPEKSRRELRKQAQQRAQQDAIRRWPLLCARRILTLSPFLYWIPKDSCYGSSSRCSLMTLHMTITQSKLKRSEPSASCKVCYQ
ncbi:hypothetical protein PoB_001055400 [Plakobranchus ocellatus]|uniref:Secreted protein n=1 Tax=Plakobranchus ocellatus TaxID=259542 RepID=A0AAV3YPJ0_9GAST|nr:hypothetical protein PoB_001055400 [Plakobranchus ocellatus]